MTYQHIPFDVLYEISRHLPRDEQLTLGLANHELFQRIHGRLVKEALFYAFDRPLRKERRYWTPQHGVLCCAFHNSDKGLLTKVRSILSSSDPEMWRVKGLAQRLLLEAPRSESKLQELHIALDMIPQERYPELWDTLYFLVNRAVESDVPVYMGVILDFISTTQVRNTRIHKYRVGTTVVRNFFGDRWTSALDKDHDPLPTIRVLLSRGYLSHEEDALMLLQDRWPESTCPRFELEWSTRTRCKLIECFVAHGWDVDGRHGVYGDTAMRNACQNGSALLIETLLQLGASPNGVEEGLTRYERPLVTLAHSFEWNRPYDTLAEWFLPCFRALISHGASTSVEGRAADYVTLDLLIRIWRALCPLARHAAGIRDSAERVDTTRLLQALETQDFCGLDDLYDVVMDASPHVQHIAPGLRGKQRLLKCLDHYSPLETVFYWRGYETDLVGPLKYP
ncbi:hypothetical protein F4780DRAFT_797922 [Xylariomycetidae sp. FL0641]|nr:hypothetical protein F4780DRAFT_797922 [Xylariomycetidae sp. FL0641]